MANTGSVTINGKVYHTGDPADASPVAKVNAILPTNSSETTTPSTARPPRLSPLSAGALRSRAPAIAVGLLFAGLIAARLPSLVQPVGGDQFAYLYIGQRINAGDLPYIHAWDHKPPGIHLIYAALWRLWPAEHVVAAADLVASVVTAGLLAMLGRRLFGTGIGIAAALLFLLLGDPAHTRLGGIRIRGQSEIFMAAAVTGALLAAVGASGRPRRLLAAGLLLGAAVWIKYNAIAYALPLAFAVASAPIESRRLLKDLGWIAGGGGLLSAAILIWLWANGGLTDLWLATIIFNLWYSGSSHQGPLAAVTYLLLLPFQIAKTHGLWFLAGLGAFGLVVKSAGDRRTWLLLAWWAAACLSIAVNGARGLPQYLVQALPALALTAAAGLAVLRSGPRLMKFAAVGLCLAGLWRVGTDAPRVAGLRLFDLPQLVDNARVDLQRWTGRLDEETYLSRFGGHRAEDKFVPEAVARLADHVRATTPPDQAIFVFGFSGAVYAKSGRRSASRFFWSLPVIIGFEAERPGFGVEGLLQDLEEDPPSLVALQKRDWAGATTPNSIDYFMDEPRLRSWLFRNYLFEDESNDFAWWVRRQ